MVLSGEKLNSNRLGSASHEVRLALDAFETAIAQDEASLHNATGLRDEAKAVLALARNTAQQVLEFIQMVFGKSFVRKLMIENRPAGKILKDMDELWCPEMVVIPGGTFLMGSPEYETGRIWTEGRQQEKTVESFALGICPVSFLEFDMY
jgi:formylglycine-generating enzyme required for sulfatase activity